MELLIHSSEQTNDFICGIGTQKVQRPRAVFAAGPAEKYRLGQGSYFFGCAEGGRIPFSRRYAAICE